MRRTDCLCERPKVTDSSPAQDALRRVEPMMADALYFELFRVVESASSPCIHRPECFWLLGLYSASVGALSPSMPGSRLKRTCCPKHCLWISAPYPQVAVTHDPNRKEDRALLKRGEYLAGGSVAGYSRAEVDESFKVTLMVQRMVQSKVGLSGWRAGHDVPDHA